MKCILQKPSFCLFSLLVNYLNENFTQEQRVSLFLKSYNVSINIHATTVKTRNIRKNETHMNPKWSIFPRRRFVYVFKRNVMLYYLMNTHLHPPTAARTTSLETTTRGHFPYLRISRTTGDQRRGDRKGCQTEATPPLPVDRRCIVHVCLLPDFLLLFLIPSSLSLWFRTLLFKRNYLGTLQSFRAAF